LAPDVGAAHLRMKNRRGTTRNSDQDGTKQHVSSGPRTGKLLDDRTYPPTGKNRFPECVTGDMVLTNWRNDNYNTEKGNYSTYLDQRRESQLLSLRLPACFGRKDPNVVFILSAPVRTSDVVIPQLANLMLVIPKDCAKRLGDEEQRVCEPVEKARRSTRRQGEVCVCRHRLFSAKPASPSLH